MKGHWIVRFVEGPDDAIATVGPFFSPGSADRWIAANGVAEAEVVPVTPAWAYSPKEGS